MRGPGVPSKPLATRAGPGRREDRLDFNEERASATALAGPRIPREVWTDDKSQPPGDLLSAGWQPLPACVSLSAGFRPIGPGRGGETFAEYAAFSQFCRRRPFRGAPLSWRGVR